MSADVVGYSRLMGDDELATVETLTKYKAIFADHISRHDGRVVDSPGDNLLAEFASPVEALAAAVDIQNELGRRNRQLAEHRQMQFRIGLNLGDVIAKDDGTLYGDGVNIAARIEALADDGGISISNTVYELVEGKLDFGYDFMGEQQVKNIAKPINVYRVRTDSEAKVTRPEVGAKRNPRVALIAVAAAVVLMIAGGVVWQATQPPPATETTAASGDPVVALPTGPSIAVLPFTNMSDDPEQEYFSDGLTEDIINGLSLFDELFVIARNSTFKYKGKAVDVREISRDLGVRYVLEGSVRRSGNTIRVSAQLLDANTGGHLWTETYDRDLTVGNIFAMQDEITDQVVATIADAYGIISQIAIEKTKSKGTESLGAYECVLLAYEARRTLTPEGHRAARDCLEGAVELDPEYAEAWAWLAYTYRGEYAHGFNPRPDLYDPLDRALEAAQRAVDLDPTSQQAHLSLADVLFLRHELGPFFVEADIAVALNPNNSVVLASMGAKMGYAGEWDKGLPLIKKAMALNPYHPGGHYLALITNHYLKGEYEEVLTLVQKMNLPEFYWTQVTLAAVHGQMGNESKAQAAINKLLELRPEFLDDPRAQFRKFNNPDHQIDAWLEGFRKAGLDIPDKPAAAD